MTNFTTAERALAEARAWIGTPYQPRASVRGVGTDCLGLVRGVWRALHGAEPEAVPPYGPLWLESADEILHLALARHLDERDMRAAQPGDVLLFRFRAGLPARHAAILSAPERMIHAYSGRAVVESALAPWWRRRCVAAFAFPDGS